MNTSQKIDFLKASMERNEFNDLVHEILDDLDKRISHLEERQHD